MTADLVKDAARCPVCNEPFVAGVTISTRGTSIEGPNVCEAQSDPVGVYFIHSGENVTDDTAREELFSYLDSASLHREL